MNPSLSEQISASTLAKICAALLGGIFVASMWSLSTLTWVWLAILAVGGAFIIRRLSPQLGLSLLLLPAFVFLGGARYQMAQPVMDSSFIASYNETDRKIYITGTIPEAPDVRDTYINLRLKVKSVDTGEGDRPAHGDVLVRLTNGYDVAYGNNVRVRGYLKTPPAMEDFSYRDYLALQGIHSILRTDKITILPGSSASPFRTLMYRVQASLLARLNALFPDPEASLFAGVLLGADKNIPADVLLAFQNTGTAHIIAISGFNIAIVSAVLILLFSRVLGKKWGSLLAILGIIIYTLLVGASPSVVRAAIMGSLAIVAALFGRRNLALNALAISALVMALINPLVLWDVGFQLSFAATLGLILYAQPMQEAVSRFLTRFFPAERVEKFIGPFTGYFLLTFAAQITTLPVIFYHFKRFSLITFLANPVILPAQPPLMILGGLAVALSKLYMPLGQVVAWLAWPFATFTIRMVEFFDKFPGGALSLKEFSLLAAVLFYIILFGLTLAWPRVKNIAGPTVVVSFLAIVTLLTWRSVFGMPDGRLHVLFMNVGSADAVLITTPGGRNVLINGGPSPSGLANQLGRRIPPFSKGLDFLVVASTQENQVGSLPRVMQQYRPKSVLWAGNTEASFSSRELNAWLAETHIPVKRARADTSYDLGDGVSLKVLAVSNRGAVLSIEMGDFKTVLPIGVTFDAFQQLDNGKSLGPVTALLISESGYAPANPPDWLVNLKPQMAILSVAANDPDGLPSQAVTGVFEHSTLIRTDLSGWIELVSDGRLLWVTSENKQTQDDQAG